MSSVDVDGISLYYEERGAGRPLVLVHGIPTDYRAWASQMQSFSAKYRTIAISRRYAVPNRREGDLLDSTVSNNAADLKKFIEKLGIAPVDLVGHSYGGFISALVATDHPGLVRSLVLVEPAVSTMLLADAESQGQMLLLLFRSPSVALAARRFQNRSLYPSFRALDQGDIEKAVELNVDGVQNMTGAFAVLPEESKKMMLENGRTVGELRTRFPRFTPAEARHVACSTLILNGESSPVWLRRIGELLGRSIPGARASVVPGTRHFPHMENPALFNEKVLAFLGSV